MCGIAGVFQIDGGPVDAGILKAMTNAIAHRGPDGECAHFDRGLGLGHRRLAVLDLSDAARQPMANEDRTLWLSYNGEIYNFAAIRAELESKGHRFRSRTDAEIVLHAFEEDGIDCVRRFNGMFVFALWDTRTRRLHLARDRYGIKPLYYRFDGTTLIFGSEVKAILAHPHVSAALNYDALNEYFTFQNLFKHHTLFKDIHVVPPANVLTFEEGSPILGRRCYWDFDFSRREERMSDEEASEETLRLLRQAIERQLVSDVPVGSYLSGGMDSGSIVAIASASIPRLRTFTCGFDMSAVTGREQNFDERREAEVVASHFGTEHFEQVINAGDIECSLPRVIWHLEDLRLGMSYPNFYIARLASKFVKVCLSGVGGDEIYGGYPWRYYRSFRSPDREAFFAEYYRYWQRLVPDEQKRQFFTAPTWARIEEKDTAEILRRVFTFNAALCYDTPEDHVANSLYFEAKTFLAGNFIVGDKLSMASGLEERVPFMDNDLVDFAQLIPVRLKLKNIAEMKRIDEDELKKAAKYFAATNDGKNCLRSALTTVLPDAVVKRPKQGFSAPDESWYRGEGIAYVRRTLLDPSARYRDFIEPAAVNKILHEHCELHINHRLLIWSLLCFEWWCRVFLDGEPCA